MICVLFKLMKIEALIKGVLHFIIHSQQLLNTWCLPDHNIITASDGSETVKTDNFTTPYIKKVEKPSKEESFWYWLILIVIVLIIVAVLIVSVYIHKCH